MKQCDAGNKTGDKQVIKLKLLLFIIVLHNSKHNYISWASEELKKH